MPCSEKLVALHLACLIGFGGLAGRLGTTADGVVDLSIDPSHGHAVPRNLFGIFFEEINHAGEGGLYAELVNDRSFDGLAYESGFLDSEAPNITLPFPLPPREHGVNPSSWHAKQGTTLSLTKEVPLNPGNRIALNFTAEEGDATIYNEGFWGISVAQDAKYHLQLYSQGNTLGLHVSLESHQGNRVYASVSFQNLTDSWAQFTALLSSNTTDNTARLAIRSEGRGPVLLDFVSLFPEENGPVGTRSPFRQDILRLLKGLHPRTIRMPGGCYVEGVRMSNGFLWGPTVGPPETRPGHWNGPWRYWSTDGLGLFEYMQLAEELSADAIWVVNNGISHEESVPTREISALLQDTLASLEFVKGSPKSKFGAMRASMGREEPWELNYVAIGNEDCGKPYYANNYLAFYEAIYALYPDMRLIANCNMGAAAPTDLWDWHWYTSSPAMFAGRNTFDHVTKAKNASIYASEYAVFDFGIPTSPGGNLQGAVAEAGFMTGLERNSHTVEMAAFAPLLVHANHTRTCPSNLIMFDGSRSFGAPSYHVQALFARYQGVKYLKSSLSTTANSDSLAASTVCLDAACTALCIKVVNFKSEGQNVTISIAGYKKSDAAAEVITLAGSSYLASNSLANPFNVLPKARSATFKGQPALRLPAWSLTLVTLNYTAASQAATEAL